jgi:hypothetical protein
VGTHGLPDRRGLSCRPSALEAKVAPRGSLRECSRALEPQPERLTQRVVKPTEVGRDLLDAFLTQTFDDRASCVVHAEVEGLAVALHEAIDEAAWVLALLGELGSLAQPSLVSPAEPQFAKEAQLLLVIPRPGEVSLTNLPRIAQ